ncbi:MAG: hypothetical protein NT015_18570 [Alphaproteobacteria bacterium]|nr:hypothetical protein [Alphaproteobacteria bacterium]
MSEWDRHEFEQQAQQQLRLHQAAENVRRQQQGHGKPIISWMDNAHGFRLVVVRNTVHWSKNWVIFPNFLLDFMKKTLGLEWGAREKDKGEHPLFRWLAKFERHSPHNPNDRSVKTIAMMGFLACWLHLAYALYLIAHHDTLPKLLLKRLRDPKTLMPAYYEAIVGAALAVAGMEISCAETKAGSTPTPEFRAASKTSGKVYEVEAKRKERWKNPTDDLSGSDFQKELESYVRDQLHSASRKKLKNPIYWFELSIPTLSDEAGWRIVAARVEAVVRAAEGTMTVDGAPIEPAFVIITNHTFLANEDINGQPSFGVLLPLKIADFPFGRLVETEAAPEAYDKYRDIFWLMEAWKLARAVPTSFDGTPGELLASDGTAHRTLRVGDVVEADGPDGGSVKATIRDVVAMNGKAMVVLTANGRDWIAEYPLSDAEVQAAARYTDAVFGKDNASRALRDDDPFDLYDWLLKARANMTAENVAKWFENNPQLQRYKDLPLHEARVRIAREETKLIWAGKMASDEKKKAQGAESAPTTAPPLTLPSPPLGGEG